MQWYHDRLAVEFSRLFDLAVAGTFPVQAVWRTDRANQGAPRELRPWLMHPTTAVLGVVDVEGEHYGTFEDPLKAATYWAMFRPQDAADLSILVGDVPLPWPLDLWSWALDGRRLDLRVLLLASRRNAGKRQVRLGGRQTWSERRASGNDLAERLARRKPDHLKLKSGRPRTLPSLPEPDQ